MTGQVKEDVISRFGELGVSVHAGEIEFSPVMLKRSEFLTGAETWRYSVGGAEQSEQMEAGSLAFSLCGVPVVYQLAENTAIRVIGDDGHEEILPGNKLGQVLSQSVFRRENRLRKIIVDVPEAVLR